MVANGQAMNKMLKASRAEAQMSMRLAEEMKKDSVAMKTVRPTSQSLLLVDRSFLSLRVKNTDDIHNNYRSPS